MTLIKVPIIVNDICTSALTQQHGSQLNSTQQDIMDIGADTFFVHIYMCITFSDRFPVPVKSAVKSHLTAWCNQNLSNCALNALTVLASAIEFDYSKYLQYVQKKCLRKS